MGSGLISGGGGGGGAPGTGDIEQVFSCTTGPCTNVTVDTGQSLGVTGSGTIAATTAAALAANPTDCAVNTFANAIAANGNLTCAAATVGDADDDATTKGVVTFLNTEFDCVAGLCNIATGGITDAQLANNYSGVGACAASKWASTLNDNAAPTCTQPNFTDLAGTATDAQIPNTITISLAATATALAADPSDCTANQYATTIAASGNLTCAQVNFNQLAGTATSAQVPLAATATALAANPTDCAASNFATGIDASGNLTCAVPAGGAASNSFETWSTPAGTAPVADSATDTVTFTAGTGMTITGTAATDTIAFALSGITDAQLASNYSGIGACAANSWASTLNDNAAPTCTQPAFTNISGSVTDAQVPDSITVTLAATATALAANPADCTANQFANAIAASGDLTCAQPAFTNISGSVTDAQVPNNITIDFATLSGSTGAFDHTPTGCSANQYASSITAVGNLGCAQPDHANLQNLAVGDPHTQYLLLAGRAGGQSANGGTAASENLTLSSTANATKGSIFFGSEWQWTEDSPDAVDGVATNAGAWTPTISITGTSGTTSQTRGIYLNPTVNYNDATGTIINNFKAVEGSGTFTVSGAGTQASSWQLFSGTATLDATVAGKSPPTPVVFRAGETIQYSATSGTGTLGTAQGFLDVATYKNIDAGGTFTLTAPTSFASNMTFTETAGALNITTGRGFYFSNPTINGTPQVTTLVGVDIDKPTRAGSVEGNIGLRNAGSTVLTPCTLTVTAGLTISPACSTIEMTSAGAVTCNTATCIAAGANGQMLTLFNFGANNITIDGNGGNTRLNAAADYVMGQWDTLTVMYSTSFVAWIEISRSNN